MPRESWLRRFPQGDMGGLGRLLPKNADYPLTTSILFRRGNASAIGANKWSSLRSLKQCGESYTTNNR
jgi:hypothetical protein